MVLAGKKKKRIYKSTVLKTCRQALPQTTQRLPDCGQNKELLPVQPPCCFFQGMRRSGGSDKKTLSCWLKFGASPAETRAAPGDGAATVLLRENEKQRRANVHSIKASSLM